MQDNILVCETNKEKPIQRTLYGWILLIWGLIYVISVFQCSGDYWPKDIDFHPEEVLISQSVTVTVTPGIISGSVFKLYDTNWYLINNKSTVQADVVHSTQDGQVLSTYENIPPASSFWLYLEEPTKIIFAAG